MTKQTWILPTLMILSIALSGCGLGFEGAGHEAEALAPLSAADWPTPLPTTLPATPTPFPKVTLAPTATPSPRPAAAVTPTPLAMAGLSFGGSIDDLVEKVTASSGGLAPVAAAMVTAGDAAVRQGPGLSYASIGVAKPGELAGVLGVNAGGDWLYVLTISQLQGWVPKNALRVTGTLDKAPVLPPDPLAEDVAQPDPSSPAAPADSNDTSASDAGGSLPLPVTELAPVTKARVDNDQLNIRQGPGAAYELLGTLSRDDEVTVLALNILGDWVLVETAAGQFGWVSLSYLVVEGSMADAPQVLSPAPGRTLPPGQVAPVFPAAVESNSTSGPSASVNPGAGTAGQGKLVFQLSSGGDVMIINPDGTGLRRLTYGIDPALAPDGQTVAFTRWMGDEGSLWLIGVDGTGERQVLADTKQAKHPAWSPDGEQIVVNFQDGGRLDPKDVCKSLIELGDKNPNIPFNAEDVEVKIIDGDPHLCWTLPPDPHWGLRTVRVADGSFVDVPSDDYAFGPEWDPANAWRIVSSGLDGLVQLDVNRRQQWRLTDRREDHTPVFSPDGRYLAVAWRNNGGQYDIHRLNSDGSGRLPLTKTPLWVTAVPDGQQPWNNVAPAWSPDGSQIAFITDRGGRWEIWVMNADGSNQRPMFADEVNDQLTIVYDFVDERVLSWR